MGCNAWYVAASDGCKMPGHSVNMWLLSKPVHFQICVQAAGLIKLWRQEKTRNELFTETYPSFIHVSVISVVMNKHDIVLASKSQRCLGDRMWSSCFFATFSVDFTTLDSIHLSEGFTSL